MSRSRKKGQIFELEIPTLIKMAEEKDMKTEIEIIKWIISVSPYWRDQGYAKSIKAMELVS